MEQIVIESDRITLPADVVRELKGKKVEFIPWQNGFLLKPVAEIASVREAIRSARGCLKHSRFSTERYFQMKREEKAFEK
jgi:hypothetical protein